jgi:hypothetical protein
MKNIYLIVVFLGAYVSIFAQIDGVQALDSWTTNPNNAYKLIINKKNITKNNASIKHESIVVTNNGAIEGNNGTVTLPQSQWKADVTVNVYTLKTEYVEVIRRLREVYNMGNNRNGYNEAKVLDRYINSLPDDWGANEFNVYVKNYPINYYGTFYDLWNWTRYGYRYYGYYYSALRNLLNSFDTEISTFSNAREWVKVDDYVSVKYKPEMQTFNNEFDTMNSVDVEKVGQPTVSLSQWRSVHNTWTPQEYYYSNLTIKKTETRNYNELEIQNSLLNIKDPTQNIFQSGGTDDIVVKVKKSSSLFYDLNGSKDYYLYIDELSSFSNVTEKKSGQKVAIISKGDAVFENSRVEGLFGIRIDGTVSSFYNMELIDTKEGIINNTNGPIHRFGINIPSATRYTSVLMGNSSFYDWNTTSFDYTKLFFELASTKYQQGYTASFKFLNHEDETPVENVLVIYSDDRNTPGGDKAKLGHYITNNEGLMVGDFDSKTSTVLTNKKRPTLYILTKEVRNKGAIVDTILTDIEIKSYLHQPIPKQFGIDAELGKINPDESVKDYYDYHLKTDDNISNKDFDAVLLYTKIDSSDQLYDVLKAKWREYEGIEEYPLLKAKGGILYLNDGWNLSVDKNAGSLCDVNTATRTVTVRADVIKDTERFNRLICSKGNIKLINNANIDFPYTDSIRDSYVRIINLDASDKVSVKYEDNTLFKEYFGEFGFPYKSRDEKFKIIVDLHTGVEALKLYDLNNAGIENKFSVGFEEKNKLFKIEDRKILNTLQDSIINELETDEELLPIHDALIKYINKKVQEPVK